MAENGTSPGGPTTPPIMELGAIASQGLHTSKHLKDGQPTQVAGARFTESELRQIDIIVQDPRTPYKTRGDFLKDVAYWGRQLWASRLASFDDTLKSYAHDEHVKHGVASAHAFHRDSDEIMHGIQDQLLIVLMSGSLQEAQRVIVSYWKDMSEIPIEYWRNIRTDRFVSLAIIKATCRILRLHGLSLPADLMSRVGVK